MKICYASEPLAISGCISNAEGPYASSYPCYAQVLALFGVCLLCTAALSQAETTPEPAKSGAELDKAIETNVEAQDYAEETTPVRAQIIKGEPAALISSGTGDISTTGAFLPQNLYHW